MLAARVLLPFALMASVAAATPALDGPRPALWAIRDADTTIYLFGTIHRLRPGVPWFTKPVRQAFDQSDTLVTETIVEPTPAGRSEFEDNSRTSKLRPGEKPLTASLSPAHAAKFRALMSKAGLSANNYEAMAPYYAAYIIRMMQADIHYRYGVENVLYLDAVKHHKRILGLEDAKKTAETSQAIADAAVDVDRRELVESLIDSEKEWLDQFDQKMNDWLSGDVAKQGNLPSNNDELNNAVVIDRNREWAQWIAQRMAVPGEVFIAVGANHLAGPYSVQTQLAAKGIQVKRIEY